MALMPSTSLHSAFAAIARQFASSVLDAVRGASLDDLRAEGTVIASRRGGVGPADGSGRGARGGGGQLEPRRKNARKSSGGRLARRSPADITATLDQVVALVKRSTFGLRSEEIRKALRLDKREVPRVLKEGLARKKLRAKGQKRATTYSAG
jgi:hypothetical protein